MQNYFIFFLCFLAINFLVFLPVTVISTLAKVERENKKLFAGRIQAIVKKLIYFRATFDSFRLLFEFQVLAFVLCFLNEEYYTVIHWLFMLVLLSSFIYISYVFIIVMIFKKQPILSNDIEFSKTGIMLFKKMIPLFLFGIVALLLALFFSGNFLVESMLNSIAEIQEKWFIGILFLPILLVSFITIKKANYIFLHYFVNVSVVNHFWLNLKLTTSLTKSLKSLKNNSQYDFINELKLEQKPNIILIFLESYGGFAFEENKFSNLFRNKLNQLNETLKSNNWKSASNLSESPILSGGSWLSHSSILFGAKVKDIAAHELIFSRSNFANKLVSLPRILKLNDYKTKLTATISFGKSEIDWEKIANAYPVDELMLLEKFNYTGKKLNFFGKRQTIPDGYTLNCAYDTLISDSPFFLCVNTTNSHYNYVSPIKTFENYKDYNTKDFEITDGKTKNNLENYYKSIAYHFDYLNTFIKNKNPDNTIIVLIGDHQPPLITPSNVGKETPIHILSKNEELLNQFRKFNYNEGLFPKNEVKSKHQSFFSKFIFVLNKVYGKNKKKEFPIFEDGIELY